jgi:histidine ammonia-lyase
MAVVLTGKGLTLDQVIRVARDGEQVGLHPDAVERMRASRAVVERAVERGEAVYGSTTGLAARKRVRLPADELERLNHLLVLHHRVGQGPHATDEHVRAAMVCLANGLAGGTAGARPRLAQLVVDALNRRHHPPVRLLGSVGEADLAPMADLAQGLLDGFQLAPGEALALLNNNAFSTGLSALAVADCERLLDAADVAGALDLEAFVANLSILHPSVAEVRPFPGLRLTVSRLRRLLEGSHLWRDGEARNLQDPLTFRCLPQVHGAARDAFDFARSQLDIELNAAQGNPLVVVEEDKIVSVGNFDILNLAHALDCLRMGLVPVLNSACERAIKLLQAPLTGLPEGLATQPGRPEEWLSEFGVAALAICGEARTLAQPVSYELAGTTLAEGIEDRMCMAPLAARRLAEMVQLGERLLAIELTVAAQAIDLRKPSALGSGTGRAFGMIRERVAFMAEPHQFPSDLEPVRDLVQSGLLRPEDL